MTDSKMLRSALRKARGQYKKLLKDTLDVLPFVAELVNDRNKYMVQSQWYEEILVAHGIPTSRQSPSLTESGAESVQPEKLNAVHQSGAASPELLPTQLPISKHPLSPEPQSTQPDTGKEK